MTKPVDPDAIFQALADMYARLDDDCIARFHARLILLLIAKVGDDKDIHEIIRHAAHSKASNK